MHVVNAILRNALIHLYVKVNGFPVEDQKFETTGAQAGAVKHGFVNSTGKYRSTRITRGIENTKRVRNSKNVFKTLNMRLNMNLRLNRWDSNQKMVHWVGAWTCISSCIHMTSTLFYYITQVSTEILQMRITTNIPSQPIPHHKAQQPQRELHALLFSNNVQVL